MTGPIQIEHQPNPYAKDPYAADPATFPHQDLNETRPFKGSGTLRRGRAGFIIVAIVGGLLGLIVWNKMSGGRPALADKAVTSFGVGTVPDDKAVQPEAAATAAAAAKGEEEKPRPRGGAKPAPPKKRESALGREDLFENPSQAYAGREVKSWNHVSDRKSSKDDVANRRRSALGN